MERDSRQEAFTSLLQRAEQQGYITFDNIMDCADVYTLPIQDFDWLTSSLTTRGIIIYDEPPAAKTVDKQDDDDFDDYAQSDYEAVYNRIIELDPSLEPFVNDVRNILPPQWKEFSQLKYQVTEGNQHARQRMVEMHLRMALRIALQRAEAYDTDIEDAVGDACIGLLTAVDKYDPDTNGAFGSYASMWMLQSISRRQPTQRPLMYYPTHRKELYFSAYSLLKKRNLSGSLDEKAQNAAKKLIQEKLGYTNEQTYDIINATIPFDSYDEMFLMFFENIGSELENIESKADFSIAEELFQEILIEDRMEEMVLNKTLKNQVADVLQVLKPKERSILELRYGLTLGEEKTLEEIGSMYGVTRERVRQIEVKALRKLRNASVKKKLIDYIDFTPADVDPDADKKEKRRKKDKS